jgi:2-aminomuconate deaminase
MATVNTFTELEVWKLASELSGKIFQVSQTTLLSKDFALKDQMNRSSGSIADNIAEGFGRGGRMEFIQFLSIARASASELQSQIIRCFLRKYFTKEIYEELFEDSDKLGKKIGAFIQYLNSSNMSGAKFNNRQPNEKRVTSNEQLETTNSKRGTINTSTAAKPLGAYPHARRVGNLLFLSGIGSRSAVDNTIPGLELDEAGNILKYDIAAETHQVMTNVKAVLEASGSCWENIVDVTVFLTNMKNDFPIYNKIYAEYFSHVQACRTTVEVKSLPTPIAIELKVIATIE